MKIIIEFDYKDPESFTHSQENELLDNVDAMIDHTIGSHSLTPDGVDNFITGYSTRIERTQENVRKLNAKDFVFDRDSSFPTRLFSDVVIEDTHYHVEAIEVDSMNTSRAVDPDLQNRIDGVAFFDGESEQYDTLILNGRHYFLVMFPYQL